MQTPQGCPAPSSSPHDPVRQRHSIRHATLYRPDPAVQLRPGRNSFYSALRTQPPSQPRHPFPAPITSPASANQRPQDPPCDTAQSSNRSAARHPIPQPGCRASLRYRGGKRSRSSGCVTAQREDAAPDGPLSSLASLRTFLSRAADVLVTSRVAASAKTAAIARPPRMPSSSPVRLRRAPPPARTRLLSRSAPPRFRSESARRLRSHPAPGPLAGRLASPDAGRRRSRPDAESSFPHPRFRRCLQPVPVHRGSSSPDPSARATTLSRGCRLTQLSVTAHMEPFRVRLNGATRCSLSCGHCGAAELRFRTTISRRHPVPT